MIQTDINTYTIISNDVSYNIWTDIVSNSIDVDIIENNISTDLTSSVSIWSLTISWWKSYYHTQSSANNTWEINHNLWFNPNVYVYDSSWDVVIWWKVEFIDENNIRIIFDTTPFSWFANLS